MELREYPNLMNEIFSWHRRNNHNQNYWDSRMDGCRTGYSGPAEGMSLHGTDLRQVWERPGVRGIARARDQMEWL